MPDHRNPAVQRQRWLADHIGPVLAVLALILLSPFLIVYGVVYFFWSSILHFCVWLQRRKWIVLVYSDSPKWKDHMEQQIIPTLPPDSAILNWSQRSRWSRFSLATQAFRRYGGSREYCPLGIVFQRGRRTQRFYFFEPFVAAKHGDLSALQAIQIEFSVAVNEH